MIRCLVFLSLVLVASCKSKPGTEPTRDLAFVELAQLAYNGAFLHVNDSTKLFMSTDKLFILADYPIASNGALFSVYCVKEGAEVKKIDSLDIGHFLNGNTNKYYMACRIDLNICRKVKVERCLKATEDTIRCSWNIEIDNKNISDSVVGEGVDYLQKNGINISKAYGQLLKEKGIFFKVKNDFYLWYHSNQLYVILKTDDRDLRFLLHILNEDGTFINKDFRIKGKTSKDLSFIKEHIVAKTKFDSKYLDGKIRIGLYVKDEGINKILWTKIIDMSLVKENELLKYNGELN